MTKYIKARENICATFSKNKFYEVISEGDIFYEFINDYNNSIKILKGNFIIFEGKFKIINILYGCNNAKEIWSNST